MSAPALPEPLANTNSSANGRSLREGCWLISYYRSQRSLLAYDGTLRVEPSAADGRIISGDLYQREVNLVSNRKSAPALGVSPATANGIPIQLRARYRYYIRVTNLHIVNEGKESSMLFEMWRYNNADHSWTNEGLLSASLCFNGAPVRYPASQDYAKGDVKSSTGDVVGQLEMGWISVFYRKAFIEIDAPANYKVPADSSLGKYWLSVFRTLGWDVDIGANKTNVTLESSTSSHYTNAETHETMLAYREAIDLDTSWHFYSPSVNVILSTPWSIFYDVCATTSNNFPREGVGIATAWVIHHNTGRGSEHGKNSAGSKPAYFCTEAYQLGHAIGLFHDTTAGGPITTVDVIAAIKPASNLFPDTIQWQCASCGLRGLRHLPDPYVRPGGVYLGHERFSSPNAADMDAEIPVEGLELKIKPLLREVPIGAPVRVSVQLLNISDSVLNVPADVSLKSEYVRGEVQKIDGGLRTFQPLIRYMNSPLSLKALKSQESISASMTLLHGGEGSLFHSSGLFEITVKVRWPLNGGVFAFQKGSSTVFVLPPAEGACAKMAHQILTTPDVLLVMILGQARKSHLQEAAEAITAASEDQVLGTHYAAIEAKRHLQLGKQGDAERALVLWKRKGTIYSFSEGRKLRNLFDEAERDGRCELDASSPEREPTGVKESIKSQGGDKKGLERPSTSNTKHRQSYQKPRDK
ncbi:uncharacterized protein KY384_001139 [Bacidia gigantensis]|uniref:uncharacterized protein n=1 Tax=Bacidia gigantensis TaxID=2732470 RepID=UPI001D0442FF|nr:uncharacterized protein KY384_001139 [Bacidia gigantensis]KAG8534295.1 hypothetical protein KY384_001139 [Bacidia gigantensis]